MRTLALLCVFAAAPVAAQLQMPHLLGDGAVLQRGEPIPIWGRASPGADVRIRLGGARLETRATEQGDWRVLVPALPPGGPYRLDVRSGSERHRAENLLVGDVWVLSGQSNMQWAVKDSENAEAEIAAADDDRIRHIRVPREGADTPQADIPGGTWEPATPDFVGDFSAVGYFFAREIRQSQGVPVGLIHASWGGSRIEPWMSTAMLGLDAAGLEATRAAIRDRHGDTEAALRDRLGGAFPSEAQDPVEGETHPLADPALDDTAWEPLRVPVRWESAGYDGLDGVAWYRTSFELSDAEAAAGGQLSLGLVDDGDHTYVNGVLVGTGRGGAQPRDLYPLPPSVLQPGRNVLAVRVTDRGGSGGLKGGEGNLFLEVGDGDRRPLAGTWRFRVTEARMSPIETNKVPTVLWNQMIVPLTEARIAGVLWYQGESNANEPDAYRELFRSLITGWRSAWGRPAMPFLWVQLAGYRQPPDGPDDTGGWPALRAAQSAALSLPRTAEALALDVGDANDIHPRDKKTVGTRLAMAARSMVYREAGVPASGPRYASHTLEDGRVLVAFAHPDGGLATRDGQPLGGFALAGRDGVWHWADARLRDRRVEVWSDAVPNPAALRYAWHDNPTSATLVNAAGLPAAPFSVALDSASPRDGR
ncbi:MAG: sialate O-acetylesterase [Bacteroidota bacterium]